MRSSNARSIGSTTILVSCSPPRRSPARAHRSPYSPMPCPARRRRPLDASTPRCATASSTRWRLRVCASITRCSRTPPSGSATLATCTTGLRRRGTPSAPSTGARPPQGTGCVPPRALRQSPRPSKRPARSLRSSSPQASTREPLVSCGMPAKSARNSLSAVNYSRT